MVERGDQEEYDSMLQLEQLETLREDMMELGITSIDELDRRISDLHSDLDKVEEEKVEED
jgi:hypothetical protein